MRGKYIYSSAASQWYVAHIWGKHIMVVVVAHGIFISVEGALLYQTSQANNQWWRKIMPIIGIQMSITRAVILYITCSTISISK